MCIFFVIVAQANGFDYDYESGPDCIVHHPPHNDEFSCGSLCDSSLLEADIVKAVYLTGFYANFDCLINKTSITVSVFFLIFSVNAFACSLRINFFSFFDA